MKEYKQLCAKAQKRFKTAKHLLTTTYPTVKDPKLLLPVSENIYYAYKEGMDSLLNHEDTYNEIDQVPPSFSGKVKLLRTKLARNYGLDEKHPKNLTELRSVLGSHEDSPIEFIRGEKYVICDDDFITKTLTEDSLKGYLEDADEFLKKTEEVVSQNDAIIG